MSLCQRDVIRPKPLDFFGCHLRCENAGNREGFVCANGSAASSSSRAVLSLVAAIRSSGPFIPAPRGMLAIKTTAPRFVSSSASARGLFQIGAAWDVGIEARIVLRPVQTTRSSDGLGPEVGLRSPSGSRLIPFLRFHPHTPPDAMVNIFRPERLARATSASADFSASRDYGNDRRVR